MDHVINEGANSFEEDLITWSEIVYFKRSFTNETLGQKFLFRLIPTCLHCEKKIFKIFL